MGWPYQQKPPMGWPLDYDSGLVPEAGFWPMLEGSGNKVFDLLGNGRTLTINGSAPSWVGGSYGSGILFPGTDEYGIVSYDKSGTDDIDFTIVMIGTHQASPSADGILQWANELTDGSPFLLFVDDGSDQMRCFYDGGYQFTAPVFTIGKSHSYAFSRKDVGNKYDFYFDGKIVGTSTDDGTPANRTSAQSLYFGNGFNGYANFVLEAAYLYDRALSASEIALLYREPFGMFKDPAEIALLGAYQVAPSGIVVLRRRRESA